MRVDLLSNFSYEDLLELFLHVRENLPLVVNHVLVIVDNASEVLRLLGELFPATESLYEPSPNELALEGRLAAVYAGESAALFDGQGLRKLFKLVKDNPKLLEMLLKLLVSAAGIKASEPAATE